MIEIVSFPGPDRSVTKEGLKRYKVSNRRYRNRRIGDILKELHLTEGRNTGFGKILRTFEENGSPKPEFETDDDHSYFISRLFVHEAFLRAGKKEREQKRAKKEPKKGDEKRSRKKMEYFAKNERRADGNTGQAYGRIQSHKKTSLENNKRSARGWIS